MTVSKNKLKIYSSLAQKKYREENNLFIAEGKKLVEEGITSNFNCEAIIATEEFFQKDNNYQSLYPADLLSVINKKEYEKISGQVNAEGILGVFQIPEKVHTLSSNMVLYFEGINDPGNLGTLLRTCDWFGIEEIILGSNTVDAYNSKTVRASMGSIFRTRIVDIDLYQNKGDYKIIVADLSGTQLTDFIKPEKFILVLASEAHGPSKEILSISDELVTIQSIGKAESLNVASAGAIILYELRK